MAVGWFICGYDLGPGLLGDNSSRTCAMDRYTATIRADGGDWSETEVLGGNAVVKVRASGTTLSTIAADADFLRIPAVYTRLTDKLTSLTSAQRTAIRNRILGMGYTAAEISTALGGDDLPTWRNVTLGQVLRFIASRRLKPRWDAANLQIVLDGAFQECRPVADVDDSVADI